MSYCTLNFCLGYSDRKLIRQTDRVFWTQIHITWMHKNYQLHQSSRFWRELDFLKDEITGKGAKNDGHCGAQTSKAAVFKLFSS